MPDIFEKLKELRKSKGMSQKQFAEMLGISERMYQKLETGKALPGHKTINSLIKFLRQEHPDYLPSRSDKPTGL